MVCGRKGVRVILKWMGKVRRRRRVKGKLLFQEVLLCRKIKKWGKIKGEIILKMVKILPYFYAKEKKEIFREIR